MFTESELLRLTFFYGKIMAKVDVVSRVTELAEQVLSSLGMELVELEYKHEGRELVLRLFIDKEGGVTLDDCESVSRDLSQILEVEDIITGHYRFEVSSPGLDRPLKKGSDYEKYAGRLVKIRTFEALADDAGNKRKTFLGELKGLKEGQVHIALKEGQSAVIPLDKIAKANLEFEF